MTHDYDAAIAAIQKAWDDNIQAHGGERVWGYTSNLADAAAGVIVNKAHLPVDIEDVAEAYLEAFRSLGDVIGVEFGGKYYFFGPTKQINEEIMHFHNILLDAAEDEGWDIEEMVGEE